MEEQIKSFLVENYGDPRLGGQGWGSGGAAHGWVGVSDRARAVIRRWLVKTSIDQFLHIVDEMALEHHWVYRKAFWTAYLKEDYITDAWVVFGPKGAAKAQQSYRLTGDESWRSIGHFERGDGSFEKNHAVLILRIGDIVVVDWSHNGKCWIWKHSNPDAPAFYKRRYVANALRRADFGQVHHYSDQYLWQGKVEQYIRQQTGIEMNRADYRVKY